MTEINGLHFDNITDDEEALLRHRGEFTERFCAAKGMGPYQALTAADFDDSATA